MPRSIYLSRHGESEYNRMGRIGGDSPLSESGQRVRVNKMRRKVVELSSLQYAARLAEYFTAEKVHDLRVWCSRKVRAIQTAGALLPMSTYWEPWKALDEIDAVGTCTN